MIWQPVCQTCWESLGRPITRPIGNIDGFSLVRPCSCNIATTVEALVGQESKTPSTPATSPPR